MPTGVFNTSSAKQPSGLTKRQQPAPKGNGKRSYHKAVRKALQEGSAQYKGRNMTLAELGGTPATLKNKPKPTRVRTSGYLDKHNVDHLSWNAGSLTPAAWEELLSVLKTQAYQAVKIVAIQETHWRGSWQFTKEDWHVVS